MRSQSKDINPVDVLMKRLDLVELRIRTKRIAFIPKHNSHGKKDVTGAFRPEAKRWAALRRGSLVVTFDNHKSKWAMRKDIMSVLALWDGELEQVAFFCHGYPRGIQAGFRLGHVKKLAESIHEACINGVIVSLFCCSTARDSDRDQKDDMSKGPGGEGGFSDRLRDSLSQLGCAGGWVDGHTVVGHTTRTPWVRRFLIHPESGDFDGGDWLVVPHSTLWKSWKKHLRNSPSFRLSFSLWSQACVLDRLRTLDRAPEFKNKK